MSMLEAGSDPTTWWIKWGEVLDEEAIMLCEEKVWTGKFSWLTGRLLIGYLGKQAGAILVGWKHSLMSLTKMCSWYTQLLSSGNAGVTLRPVETSNSFPPWPGCLLCWAYSRGGVLLWTAFRCLNTSSSSFASMTSLGMGCLLLGWSFLWRFLSLLVTEQAYPFWKLALFNLRASIGRSIC